MVQLGASYDAYKVLHGKRSQFLSILRKWYSETDLRSGADLITRPDPTRTDAPEVLPDPNSYSDCRFDHPTQIWSPDPTRTEPTRTDPTHPTFLPDPNASLLRNSQSLSLDVKKAFLESRRGSVLSLRLRSKYFLESLCICKIFLDSKQTFGTTQSIIRCLQSATRQEKPIFDDFKEIILRNSKRPKSSFGR